MDLKDFDYNPAYAKLTNVDIIPNYVIAKLKENDDFCKLLKFDSSDALYKTITDDDKKSLNKIMITEDENGKLVDNRRIFLHPFVNKTQTEQRCEVRIYPIFEPLDRDQTKVNYILVIDIVCHWAIADLDDNISRIISLEQNIMKSLSGENFDGAVGKLVLADITKWKNYSDYYTGCQIMFKTFAC